MDIDILRAELERLFELDELRELSAKILDFDPDEVGGAVNLGSFAFALTRHCVDNDSIEALCDAVVAQKHNFSPNLLQIGARGLKFDEELGENSNFAGFHILRKLGEGRLGKSYLSRKDETDFRLKVLHREATRDQRGVNRFLAMTRLIGTLDHPGLPKQVICTRAEGRYFVAHRHVEGQSLSARFAHSDPVNFEELKSVLVAILEPLSRLHDQRLAHGDLRLENLISQRDAEGSEHVVLLDAGSDRLRARARLDNGRGELFSTVASVRTASPEQIQGFLGDARSDLYALGVILYELLTGRAAFKGANALEVAFGHLTKEPDPPSKWAPSHWVSPELDALVLSLLEKNPAERPAHAQAVLELLNNLERASRAPRISKEELSVRIERLLANPFDEHARNELDSAIAAGADAFLVAQALEQAASKIAQSSESAEQSRRKRKSRGKGKAKGKAKTSSSDAASENTPDTNSALDSEPPPSSERKKLRVALLSRAAELYETKKEGLASAERVYAVLHDLAPEDSLIARRLFTCERRLGKYEQAIELLLSLNEKTTNRSERGRMLAEIGEIYARDLDDPEQAIFAYTQAFCEDPTSTDYSAELEQLSNKHQQGWPETLSNVCEAAQNEETPAELRALLWNQAARWYENVLARPDLAGPCYDATLKLRPTDSVAYAGLCRLSQVKQDWPALSQLLLRRADSEASPAKARDHRAEAAAIFAQQLGQLGRARELYERILDEDPGHAKAREALIRLCEQAHDFGALVKLLEQHVQTLSDDEKPKLLCRIAAVYHSELSDPEEAVKRYNQVLGEWPDNLQALSGLDRVYSETRLFQPLLENLKAQVDLSSTPRQKIELWERIARIHEQEFFDHREAAAAWESVLELDGKNQRALMELARHYRALDRWEDVAAIYERHLTLAIEPEQRLELALALGRVLEDQLSAPERATFAYEMVLRIEPEHAEALETMARLRETAGDATAALRAIGALAEKAKTTEGRAEQFLRAARLLESTGGRDRAIEHYKRALDACPDYPGARASLREAYVARGDINAALNLLEQEISSTQGDRAKAELAAEMARLAYEALQDDDRAEQAAKQALTWDPTNLTALTVLGDVCFENRRFVEASTYFERVAERADTLEHKQAVRILMRFADALANSGSTEKALAPMDILLRLSPDDPEALERVAYVTLEHGSPKRAVELHKKLLKRFGDTLEQETKARLIYRQGEALRRAEAFEEAIAVLDEASDLDPTGTEPLIALSKCYAALEQWEKLLRTKSRHLDIATDDERVELLMEMGELAWRKLGDTAQAAKSYGAALEESPNDRRLLNKLMQLYSEEKEWGQLTDVVVKLAEFVDEPGQKVKYLQTAAIIAARQLGDVERALEFYEQVLQLDPSSIKAINEAIEVTRDKNDHEGVERLLRRKLEAAQAAGDRQSMIESFEALGQLYQDDFGLAEQAIDAFEAAQTLDPQNKQRASTLNQLYAGDPERYLDKAVASQTALLRENPLDADAYRFLRRLYTDAKRGDASWCLCQALSVLNLAEPDEERFYRRMRSETAAPAQEAFGEEDWLNLLMHPECDPMLTSIFALIEPAVIAQRAQTPEELGYEEGHRIDPASYPYPIAQNLHYAAGVLGIECPPCYSNTNDPGGLMHLHTHDPAMVLGLAAHALEVPPQAAAFVAARQLSYLSPGLYLRQLIGSGTGLKSWLFAAVKLTAPQFPVAPELEGPVSEALAFLKEALDSNRKEAVTRIAAKLIQSGASIDLKRWVIAVDFTADRAGFVVAHDLRSAVDVIEASETSSDPVSAKERLKELTLYAVSSQYVELRHKLGVTLDF